MLTTVFIMRSLPQFMQSILAFCLTFRRQMHECITRVHSYLFALIQERAINLTSERGKTLKVCYSITPQATMLTLRR